MADTVYCYPDSDVLKNKLEIRDKDKLHEMERKLTHLRTKQLIDHPVMGGFDLAHLMWIHRFIFQDIYDWAGKLRTVDIAKSNMFCNVRFIESQATEIFGALKNEKYLAGLDERTFVKRIAYYFSEINALHPFREGNGRAQREFIRLLALRNGYLVMFDACGSEEMLEASKESFLCRYEKMEALFEKCLCKL